MSTPPSLPELVSRPVESPALVRDAPDGISGRLVLQDASQLDTSVLLPPALAKERLSCSGKVCLRPSPHFSSTQNILEDLEAEFGIL